MVRTLRVYGFGVVATELAKTVGCSRIWMLRVLKQMEARGLVRRREFGGMTIVWYAQSLFHVKDQGEIPWSSFTCQKCGFDSEAMRRRLWPGNVPRVEIIPPSGTPEASW